MNTDSNNHRAQLTEIAKAVGAILGVPLALFAVLNSIIAQPITSLVVALIAAALASVWIVLSRWTSITQIITAWLALAVVVLAGFVIWPRTMTVEGFICDTAGNPVSNEAIRLFDCSGKIYETKTDIEGYYQFTGVPSGKYRVQVRTNEIEGETKGILVRVVQQNLTVSEILATASPTSVAAVTPDTPTAIPILPTNTPVPPTATPTLEPLQAAQAWPLVLRDSFDTNDTGWWTGNYTDTLENSSRGVANGTYVWRMEILQDGVFHWHTPPIDPISDFYLTVKVRQSEGVEHNGIYGVVLRRQGETFYAFRVNDDQSFRFSLRHEGNWEDLIERTESSSVRPRQVNQLTVIANGSHFSLYINDHFVGDVTDKRLSRGNVGLIVELVNAGDESVFEFDDFELHRKP